MGIITDNNLHGQQYAWLTTCGEFYSQSVVQILPMLIRVLHSLYRHVITISPPLRIIPY